MKVGCASAFTPTRGNRASAYGPDTRIDCRAPQYEGHCAVYDSIRSSSCSSSRGASCASSASVASSTRRCCTGSPGRPRVEPRARRVIVARGGIISRVTPPFQLVSVVATPSCSSARATSPTDWLQSGQLGTSRAAWAPSVITAVRIAGMSSSSTRPTSGW